MDFKTIEAQLDQQGYTIIPNLLDDISCRGLISLYENPALFRKKVNMERHRFGKGEYQYFHEELPVTIQEIRSHFYQILVPIANKWNLQLKQPITYPETLDEFLDQCASKGQHLLTPLILRYHAGDFNCLHKDLYGNIYFPFQMMISLTQKEQDFSGGEFLLLEQKYMSQSSCEVITPNLGDAVIFATQFRPTPGKRGFYKAQLKHGVSKVRSGSRYSLGVIFHNAKT